MSPAFLTWLSAQRRATARITKQFHSNLPKGIF